MKKLLIILLSFIFIISFSQRQPRKLGYIEIDSSKYTDGTQTEAYKSSNLTDSLDNRFSDYMDSSETVDSIKSIVSDSVQLRLLKADFGDSLNNYNLGTPTITKKAKSLVFYNATVDSFDTDSANLNYTKEYDSLQATNIGAEKINTDKLILNTDTLTDKASANYWAKTGTDLYYNDGMVGIGNTPSFPLDVRGVANFRETINFSNPISYPGISTRGFWFQVDAGITFQGSGTIYDMLFANQSAQTVFAVLANTKKVYINNTIGIGTQTPDSYLDVEFSESATTLSNFEGVLSQNTNATNGTGSKYAFSDGTYEHGIYGSSIDHSGNSKLTFSNWQNNTLYNFVEMYGDSGRINGSLRITDTLTFGTSSFDIYQDGTTGNEIHTTDTVEGNVFKDANGVLTSIDFGTSGQVPYVNSSGDGYLYSSNFTFSTGNSNIGQSLTLNGTGTSSINSTYPQLRFGSNSTYVFDISGLNFRFYSGMLVQSFDPYIKFDTDLYANNNGGYYLCKSASNNNDIIYGYGDGLDSTGFGAKQDTACMVVNGVKQFKVTEDTIFNNTNVKIDSSLTVEGKASSAHYYGQIYTSTGISKTTTPINTYRTITGFTTDGFSNTTLADSTITVSSGGSGLWKIGYYANSVTHTNSTVTVHISLFIDDIEFDIVEGERKIGTGGDIGSFSAGAYFVLTGSEVLKLKVKADKTGTFSSGHFNFYATRIN